MNFDYTYITVFGCILFEPMVMLTNGVFFVLALFYNIQLKKYSQPYIHHMRRFLFLLGVSTLFGALGHVVHYQLGHAFFSTVLFLMNAFSLAAMYFCFLGPYTYAHPQNKIKRNYNLLILVWMALVLFVCTCVQNFVIIKIHAGVVLLYSLIVHWSMYKRHLHLGSKWIVGGILAAFLPIIVHSLKVSVGEWLNHKDIAHVLMIISLMIIYTGVSVNARELQSGKIQL